METYLEGLLLLYMNLVTSRDESKTSYLHYHNTCGHSRVVIFYERLPLISSYDPSLKCIVRSRDKSNILYLQLH